MFYDRKVKYLDYCENGIRIKGCGVVKVQVREKKLNMEVMVSGLPAEDTFRCGVSVCTHGREALEIGEIKIENGKGNFSYRCENIEELHRFGDYDGWSGIRIVLGENREIRGIWKIDTGYTETMESSVIDKDCKLSEIMQREETAPKEEVTQKPETAPKEKVTQNAEIVQKEVTKNVEILQKEETIQKGGIIQKAEITQKIDTKTQIDTKVEAGRTLVRALEEDKWEQLWNIYPHIRPFRDEREYISITPADFVIFTADSYKAVNNSFLLHGFYNYHHLLLTRMERKGEMVYYVGVPGNYFEREKQVAIMFGFESFECQEEPAQAGDFGYYMMRAQL